MIGGPRSNDLSHLTDEELEESAAAELWADLLSPDPAFRSFALRCKEAHRRGKPEILKRVLARLVPPPAGGY